MGRGAVRPGPVGVTSWRLGPWQLDVLAAVAAFFFLLSLTSAGLRAYTKPERDRMLELRHSTFDVRRASYKRFRIEDQIGWYQDKAKVHRGRANRWLGVTIGASVAGVAAAGVKFVGGIDVDLLGVAAAVASAAIAWNQLSQNRVLVSAYTVTARELNIIRGSVDVTGEAEWPQFVSDAEDAVSREHTMWAARHGHPVRLD